MAEQIVPFSGGPPPMTEGIIIDLWAVQNTEAARGLDKIYFTYMPDMFEETKTAEYANINVIGRSEPILGYSHSGPRIFNIPLIFAASTKGQVFKEVLEPIWLIRSWVYPDYSNNQIPNIPPRVLLVLGSWLSQRCVVISVNIRYHSPWGRSPNSTQGEVPGTQNNPERDSMLPYWAEVNLVLQETMDNSTYTPYGNDAIRRGEDRGSGFI